MTRVPLGGGKVTDPRTLAMLDEAQRLAGLRFQYAQGSYNGNAVFASGGTHAGGGVIDIRTVPMKNRAEKLRAVKALRQVGFAAWLRPYAPGVWGEHIHAVAIGQADLSSAAGFQVKAYRNGRDGLKGNRVDPQASLGVKPTTWEAYKRSLKPTKGRATVVHPLGAPVRREPGGHSQVVRRRPKGSRFTYTAVRYVDDVAYLRLLSGNWIRSSKTSRGA
jgi:hypothetical protein